MTPMQQILRFSMRTCKRMKEYIKVKVMVCVSHKKMRGKLRNRKYKKGTNLCTATVLQICHIVPCYMLCAMYWVAQDDDRSSKLKEVRKGNWCGKVRVQTGDEVHLEAIKPSMTSALWNAFWEPEWTLSWLFELTWEFQPTLSRLSKYLDFPHH